MSTRKDPPFSVGLKSSAKKVASQASDASANYLTQQKLIWKQECAKLREDAKLIEKLRAQNNYSAENCTNGEDVKLTELPIKFSAVKYMSKSRSPADLPSNLSRDMSSSAKSVRFKDESMVTYSDVIEKKPKLFVKKLFHESQDVKQQCAGKEIETVGDFAVSYDPDGSKLNVSTLNCSIDSNLEFNQYETMCAESQNLKDIPVIMRNFIQKQNEDLQEKVTDIITKNNIAITKLVKDNNDAITSKFEELYAQCSQTGQTNKENIPMQPKRKSGNLRKEVIMKAKLACCDTPNQRKMTKCINMYNGMRGYLDSPCISVNSMQTPDKKVLSKKDLSVIVQKQCFALLD